MSGICIRRDRVASSPFWSRLTHRVSLEKVKTFALHGTVQGQADVLRKERIKAMLGLE